MSGIEKFQVGVGIVVSVATAIISWETYRLGVTTENNTTHLKAIEQQLAETRFGFERIRDVYDRTEKYLASPEQNEARGRVLVVLINSLPDNALRAELLSVVTLDAKSSSIAAKAADLKVGTAEAKPTPAAGAGFSGDRSLQFDSEKYQVVTVGSFSFVDSKGITWSVPKGYVVNGASIPRAVWSVVGSPLASDYAVATILHDYHADQRTRSSEEVNRMFYEALIKLGVNETKAKILYSAVSSFGPRWETVPRKQQ